VFESWKIELVPRSSRIREQSGTALLSKMDSVHARLLFRAGLFSCPGADGRIGPRVCQSTGKGSLDFWSGVLIWSADQFSQCSQ